MRQLSFDDRLRPRGQSTKKKRRSISWFTIRKRVWKRKRTIIWTVCLIGLSLVVGIWVSKPNSTDLVENQIGRNITEISSALGMRVSNVFSEGRKKTSVKDILQALRVKRGDPIINFDAAEAQSRVEALGWVRSAVVTRKLPDSIYIQIQERKPFALWQSQGRVTLIDHEGKEILDTGLESYNYLPLIVGDDARKYAPELFDVMASQPDLFRQVLAAVRIGNRRWDILFVGGLRVYLPQHGISNAWTRLAAANSEKDFFNRDISTVDLRLPDRMIIRVISENKIDGETT